VSWQSRKVPFLDYTSISPLGLFSCDPSLVETIQSQVNLAEIHIFDRRVWPQAKRFTGFGGGLLVLPQNHVDTAQIAGRHIIPRISLPPQFVRLIRFFQLARGECVVARGDVEFLGFGDAVAQFLASNNRLNGS
jgi:hypothetical protein